MVKHGIDIVCIPRFKETFLREEAYFKEKVFTAEEYGRFLYRQRDINHLAGIFAAKEAVMKAMGLPAEALAKAGVGEKWLEIEIGIKENGSPFVKNCPFAPKDSASSLSISHDGEYAVASVIFSQT